MNELHLGFTVPKFICNFSKCNYPFFIKVYFQPGLIKISVSVHFLWDTVLRTLLRVSPQFQREMSTEWR